MSAGECERTQRKVSGRGGGVNANEGRWVRTGVGVGRCERGWAIGGQMLAGAGAAAAEAAATAQAATMAAADAPFSFT